MKLSFYGNEALKNKCSKVEVFDETLSILTDEMIKFMREKKGVGLAASQIGEDKQILVYDISYIDPKILKEKPKTMINPQIVNESIEDIPMHEGCLSFLDLVCKIWRPLEISVSYQDISGNTKTETFKGVESRVIQHEIDHLNGVLMIDRLSKADRFNIGGKLHDIRNKTKE